MKLYVGRNDGYLAEMVLKIDSAAKLITSNNCDIAISNTGYTSLADITSNELVALVNAGVAVEFLPTPEWNDRLRAHTEHILYSIASFAHVAGLDTIKSKYLQLVDSRKSNSRQLWAAGCSITVGVGVDKDESYPFLVANALHLDLSLLALDSSGIQWASDQILRSDVRKDDIVVWGLTGNGRVSYWDTTEHLINGWTSSSSNLPMDRLLEEDLLAKNIKAIHQVINFCNKSNATLLLVGLLDQDIWTKHLFNTGSYVSFAPGPPYSDVGSDNMHPGKKIHQRFSDLIIKKLKTIK